MRDSVRITFQHWMLAGNFCCPLGDDMALTRSRIPQRLGMIGIITGFGLMTIWWYVDKYDLFHLPTWQQAQGMGNFSEPPLYKFLEDLTFALCPGSFLHVFTMDMGNVATYLTWSIAALLNGPLYYAIGLLIAALTKRNKDAPRR
jgi:hypothetical protein